MTSSTSDDEILDRIRSICLAFPEADEATLQDRPLFHVHRRRFAIYNADHLLRADGSPAPARRRWAGTGRSIHFLADPAERDALRADPRFTPSPHHGDRGWLALALPPAVPPAVPPPPAPRAEALGTTTPASDGMRAWERSEMPNGALAWQEVAELLDGAYRAAAPRRLVDVLDEQRSQSGRGSPLT